MRRDHSMVMVSRGPVVLPSSAVEPCSNGIEEVLWYSLYMLRTRQSSVRWASCDGHAMSSNSLSRAFCFTDPHGPLDGMINLKSWAADPSFADPSFSETRTVM